MLFIAAVNKMLDQMDALFRLKLKLGPLDSLTNIERQLLEPLLTDEYLSTENARTSVESEVNNESINFPLRFVGINWFEFLALSDEQFKTSMRDNLSGLGLDTKKLLILYRLRKNIDSAKNEVKQRLEARDAEEKALESKEEGKKAASKKGKKSAEQSLEKSVEKLEILPSVETALLVTILSQIDQAAISVNLARGLSGTDVTGNITFHGGIGETEILLQKMRFLLKEYIDFATDVDKKTKREVGNLYALRDMLPSVQLRDDFVIKCHLAMHEYILRNLDEYSQYNVDQKRSFSLKYVYTQMSGQFYYPDVSVQKRTQVIEFLVTLYQKTRDYTPESVEYQTAVLSCIDTYLSMAHTTNQSRVGGMSINFNKSAPKLEVAYRDLHEALVAKLPHSKGDSFHKCQATKLLK